MRINSLWYVVVLSIISRHLRRHLLLDRSASDLKFRPVCVCWQQVCVGRRGWWAYRSGLGDGLLLWLRMWLRMSFWLACAAIQSSAQSNSAQSNRHDQIDSKNRYDRWRRRETTRVSPHRRSARPRQRRPATHRPSRPRNIRWAGGAPTPEGAPPALGGRPYRGYCRIF